VINCVYLYTSILYKPAMRNIPINVRIVSVKYINSSVGNAEINQIGENVQSRKNKRVIPRKII